MTGVYWWDPWHNIYSSTMDPSWVYNIVVDANFIVSQQVLYLDVGTLTSWSMVHPWPLSLAERFHQASSLAASKRPLRRRLLSMLRGAVVEELPICLGMAKRYTLKKQLFIFRYKTVSVIYPHFVAPPNYLGINCWWKKQHRDFPGKCNNDLSPSHSPVW